jgi:hypothetical protein
MATAIWCRQQAEILRLCARDRRRRASWTLAEQKRVSLIIRSAIACPNGGPVAGRQPDERFRDKPLR